ncbi:hypothetical protein ACSYAD_00745 [Acaryochloris marina NIES-2412]|uniref:hypothetical protein n=1 Tax=Acaryochloris marina TaxID=155978 RepID=UPI004059FF8F
MDNREFQVVNDLVQKDDWSCIRLDTAVSGGIYHVLIYEIGQILLESVFSDLASELWLWNNPKYLASVCKGMQQVARGEVHHLGSFTQYVDIEVND